LLGDRAQAVLAELGDPVPPQGGRRRLSAVADPNTGVAVHDSYQSSGRQVFGGTSVSSPIIASVFALAGFVVDDTAVNGS
jgi:hypothetical protein